MSENGETLRQMQIRHAEERLARIEELIALCDTAIAASISVPVFVLSVGLGFIIGECLF